jgi:cytochrome P450
VVQIDFSDPGTNADPFPAFAHLQEEDPVHWSASLKAWIITRYDHVETIALSNEEVSANRVAPFFAAAPPERRNTFPHLLTYLGDWMVFRDPPDHTRLRRLFSKAFTSRSVEVLRPNIQQIIEMLFVDVEGKARAHGAVDWIADFAYPLPAMVIMDLLGVPRAELRHVKVWSDDIALFIGSAQASADKYERAETGARAIADFFRGIVRERRADPRDDIISTLVIVREEREVLSEDEVIATCILLLFAGHETTTNLIGTGLYHTMRFREQWERLKGDPSLFETAIEEWLRFDGPTTALARVVKADIEFGGRPLVRGQRVFAFTNAANRDPRQFANAGRLDLGRTPNPHLTFGHGIHFCLGAPLARLEGQIALRNTVERFPDIRLADPFEPEWHDSLILRGLKSLPVRLRGGRSPPLGAPICRDIN